MENQNIKYFLYARRSVEKSDKEDRVPSIESQNREINELVKRQNLKVVGTFTETKSAKKPYVRKAFYDMLEQIKTGQANGILCWKMDRLARNALDAGTLQYLLQEGVIKNIKATDRDFYPEDNILMSSVEFGVANQFSRDLSKHVKRGLRAKLELGQRPGLAPLGYKNSRFREKGKEEILVDDERFFLVRKLFDQMLTGKYNAVELIDVAQKMGLTMRSKKPASSGKRMSKCNIYRILTNPFYYGEFECPEGSGNWYQGNHEPIITRNEYDRIQFLLGREGKPRNKNHKFTYTGLLKCGYCGASITAELKVKKQKNGNVHFYTYYHCTRKINPKCIEKAVEEKELNGQIKETLKGIRISKLLHEWAIGTLKEKFEDEKMDRNKILYKKQEEYNQVVKKLDNLLDVRLSGEIDQMTFSAYKAKLEKEREILKGFLDNIDLRIEEWFKKAEGYLDFAEKAENEFDEGDPDKKREILAALGYNHSIKDKKLNVSKLKVFSAIEKLNFEAKKISTGLEPIKSVAKQQQIKSLYDKSILMCG